MHKAKEVQPKGDNHTAAVVSGKGKGSTWNIGR
jgi:hypothetical protein